MANLFSPASPSPARPHVVRVVRGRYDAAQTNDDNRRHWANADALSANAANSPEVRTKLRNRSRYEVANNSYARGIVSTLANDLIGTGPRLQVSTGNVESDRVIERQFARWSAACRLPEKLRTMRMSRAVDGEAFAILATNSRLSTEVKLDLRLIEAERVTTPHLIPIGSSDVDGIQFDAFGNPENYHVLRSHPGGTFGTGLEYDTVPAEQVIHWFKADRPEQARGIPDIMPSLPLFAQLRRFTLAVLAAAETAADFAGIMYTDAPATGEAESAEPFEAIEIEKRALLTMPSGWKMSQLKAEQPATTYAEFKQQIIKEIARCLNMPANVALGDSSGYNYSSGRLDHQTYFRSIDVEHSDLETIALDRIVLAWLEEAMLIPGIIPSGLPPFAEWTHQWFWNGREHIDPTKDATAQQTRIATGVSNLAIECANEGRDWEVVRRQRARELDLDKELNIPNETTPEPKPATRADVEEVMQDAA